jgi:hypothetical protein
MGKDLELTEAELDALGWEKPRLVPLAPLARLRDSHHWLARSIASGKRYSEVAFECGYSVSRISILMADPAFQELVALYRREFHEKDMDFHLETRHMLMGNFRKFARLQSDLADDIAEDHEAGKPIPAGTVHDNVISLADRLGHGKTSTQISVDANGLADRIAAARKEYLKTKAPPEPKLVEAPKEPSHE